MISDTGVVGLLQTSHAQFVAFHLLFCSFMMLPLICLLFSIGGVFSARVRPLPVPTTTYKPKPLIGMSWTKVCVNSGTSTHWSHHIMTSDGINSCKKEKNRHVSVEFHCEKSKGANRIRLRKCSHETVIHIFAVFYGRLANFDMCSVSSSPQQNDVSCIPMSPEFKDTVLQECNNKKNCNFNMAQFKDYVDPCGENRTHIKKYLAIFYTCSKNNCDPNVCQNGATCVSSLTGYRCICPAGTTGINCESRLSECDPPCENSGTCIAKNGTSYCDCGSSYYMGRACQFRNPCTKPGFCREDFEQCNPIILNNETEISYNCSCIGHRCETLAPLQCNSQEWPCQSQGKCLAVTSICRGLARCPGVSFNRSLCRKTTKLIPLSTTTADCAAFEWRCGALGGVCLPFRKLCSGEVQCGGAGNELHVEGACLKFFNITTTTTPPHVLNCTQKDYYPCGSTCRHIGEICHDPNSCSPDRPSSEQCKDYVGSFPIVEGFIRHNASCKMNQEGFQLCAAPTCDTPYGCGRQCSSIADHCLGFLFSEKKESCYLMKSGHVCDTTMKARERFYAKIAKSSTSKSPVVMFCDEVTFDGFRWKKTKVNDVGRVRCRGGNEITRRCLEGGNWGPIDNLENCVGFCPKTETSGFRWRKTKVNDVVRNRCANGNEITRRCLEGGVWDKIENLENCFTKFCPKEESDSIRWKKTKAGTTVEKQCPTESSSISLIRRCMDDGQWGSVENLKNCTASMLNDLGSILDGPPRGVSENKRVLKSVKNYYKHVKVLSRKEMKATAKSILPRTVDFIEKTVSRIPGKADRLEVSYEATETVVSIADKLIQSAPSSSLSDDEKAYVSLSVMKNVEKSSKLMAENTEAGDTRVVNGESTVVQVVGVKPRDRVLDLPIKELQYDLELIQAEVPLDVCSPINGTNSSCGISYVHYENLGQHLESANQSNSSGIVLNSNILSLSLGGTPQQGDFQSPVKFTFAKSNSSVKGKTLCSFWDFEMESWSQKGCRKSELSSDNDYFVCECYHMTHFAVLVDVNEFELTPAHKFVLHTITYFGISISLVCLLISWLIFQFIFSYTDKLYYQERNSIHKNLVFCLFVAELVFLFGIGQTTHKLACSIIAVVLHYFFLAAFSWMCAEGIILYFMLVSVFECSLPRLPFYYVLSYGFPALIVTVSAIMRWDLYGTAQYCWLSKEQYLIWSFVGPVMLVVLVNTVMLLVVFCRLRKLSWRSGSKVTTRKYGTESTSSRGSYSARSQTTLVLSLVVVMGLTWLFGFFYMSESTIVFAYLFTIANAFQGLFIFIFYCLVDKEAKRNFKRFARQNSCMPEWMKVSILGSSYSQTLSSQQTPSSSQPMRRMTQPDSASPLSNPRPDSNKTSTSTLPIESPFDRAPQPMKRGSAVAGVRRSPRMQRERAATPPFPSVDEQRRLSPAIHKKDPSSEDQEEEERAPTPQQRERGYNQYNLDLYY